MIGPILGLTVGALALNLLTPHSALAWGDEGHEVVALIAQAHLNPATLKRVNALLRRIPTR
jgi:hypothetical protein